MNSMWTRGVAAVVAVLLAASVALAQPTPGGGGGIPQPVVNGQCIIGSGGQAVWGACSGAGTAVTSVTGTAGEITVSPTTGDTIVSLPSTITQNTTFSGTLVAGGAFSATNAALTTPTIAGGALSGTFSGTPTYSGVPILSGLSAGTQVSCLGLDSGNHVVLNAAACGGSVSITAGTPNIVVTPSPITGTGTVGTTNAQNSPADGGSHSYTVLSGDATKEVVLVSTFTGMAVPQATGSFAAGYSFTGVNQGAVTATSTTSTVNGIAGATGIKLGANQFSQWDALGGNWVVGLGLPQPATQTGTTFLRDDMTWPTIASLGANPTASAGIAAVNGSASTFMRSDGAPAVPAMTATVAGLVPTPPNDASKFLNGQGAFTAPSGSGGGGGLFQYSDNGLTLTAGTRFVPVGGSGVPSTTEADYSTKAPSALTVNNLQVNLSADPGAGQTLVVTLRKAGVDQALTCTVTGGAGAVCQDLNAGHAVAVAQNDLIDWKIVTTGTFVATPSVTILANSGTTNNGITGSGTTNGLAYFSGSAAATSLAAATDGQIPIGSTGAAPVLGTITAGSGVTVTNGAGTITVAATGPTIGAVSTAQLDRTSNTTLADITGLTLSLAAGKTYTCHGFFPGVAAGAGGMKLALVNADTLTVTSINYVVSNITGPTQGTTTLGTGIGSAGAVASGLSFQMDATIVVNAAGTVKVQGAQFTSNVSTTSFFVNAYLQCTKIN